MSNMVFFDSAFSGYQIFFQDPATPVMEGIINFHHDLLSLQLFIGVFVLWFLLRILFLCKIPVSFFGYSYTHGGSFFIESINSAKTLVSFNNLPKAGPTHNTLLEVIWTVIPACILLYIAIPSFALLYSMDELTFPLLTYKIVGNQWYWVYEHQLVNGTKAKIGTFESRLNLDQNSTLTKGWPYDYLLATDRMLKLPFRKPLRLLMTSNDVLHSWTIPSFGIKLDACPGRLNQTGLYIKRCGLFYGQCSEICGVNHAFMPITVRVVDAYNGTFVSTI